MVKPRAKDDEVTARTPQVPQPTTLPPNQDFSPQAAYKRDLAKSEDYRETRRELSRYLNRVEEQQFDFTWQRNQTIEHYQNVAEELGRRETSRQQKVNLSNFPQMNQWVNQAKSAGYNITEDHIKNLVDYSILNDAADVVIAGLRPDIQDPYVADNVLLSLAETDPVAASFLPSIVEAKLLEQGENENSILNNPVMRWLGNNKVLRDLAGTAGTFVSATLYPFMEALDWSMEGARGATYRQYRSPLGETPLSWVPLAQGFFSSEDRRAATGLNENYIQAIRDAQNPDGTPVYQPIEIDVVVDLVQLQMDGDPYPAATLINGKYNGDMQAAKVITDLAYNRSTSNVQELVRQVKSANMSDTGRALLGAVSPDPNFNEARGSQVRDNLADVTGVVAGFALDPTNAAFGLGRAFQAARWSLTKLAPGVDGANQALQAMRLGPEAMARAPKFNPAYRFADNFTKDLNTYDDLLSQSSEARKAGDTQKAVKLRADAGELRARMSNDYDNMPEQLIEDFYKQMPRNADGKFDVQTYASWIDDSNKAYVTLVGDVIPIVEQAGAADAAKRAVLAQLLATESGDGARAAAKSILATLDQQVAPELAEQVRPVLEKVIAAKTDDAGRAIAESALVQFGQEYQGMVAPLIKQVTDAHDRLFYSQVGRLTERRTPLIPRMSAVAAARKDAINGIKISQSRSGVIDKMIAKYLPRVENPAEFAEDFSASAEEIGQAVRSYKTGGEMAPLSGTADSISKMLASLPSVAVLSTTDASSTQAFYRFSRAFMPKRFARLIADEWRAGTSGSRRKMLNALIRSAAASRGVRLTEQQAEELATRFAPGVGDLGTGTKTGEQYGVSVVGGVLPSERAARLADPSRVVEEIDPSVKVSLSADRNGIEHALHLDDTAGAVRIPTVKDFENLRREQGLLAQGYHMMGTPLQATTDVMSYLTLAGPKFSLRNAIEEDGLFIATGGGTFNLAKGRVMDQWLRRANPRLVPVTNAKGEVELVRKTSLGMIANKMEWFSLRAKERGLPEWFSEFIYSTVTKSEIEEALLAKQAGHMEPLQELLVKTQVAHVLGKFRWNILSRQDKEVFKYLADSPYGMALYDQVAGQGQYLFSGDIPRFMFDQNSITDAFPGVTYGKVKPPSPIKFKGYDNIPPVQVDDVTGQRIFGVSAWWRQLEKTLVGDGDIGEAAVRLLDNPQAAKVEVARIIREDKTFGYKEKLSRISDDMSIDEFANSYVENVFQHFTKADGSLNNELRSRLLSYDPETGKLRASLWKPSTTVDGAETYALRMSDLEDIPMADRPSYVFGPIVDETPYIPIAETEAALLSPTRGYGWMARQNTRISKGPIFMANLTIAWKETTIPRARLAQTMAEAGGRTKPNANDIDLANRLYFKNSADQAFSNTISFIDNPANRSNLAWKARNVSRYYRATEDFWRRMKRVAVNRPETFWKIALTYHLLEDTGFVFKDEEGSAYFAYPGNQQLQQVIAAAGMLFFERDTNLFKYLNTNPFFIGGKVTGITPSTDPLQQVPSVFGPLAIPLIAIYNAFPALYKMKGLQKLTLGEYQPVTGNTARDSLAAATPPLVQRILGLLDIEQFDSTVAQGAIDSMAIMAANGSLDELTINGKTVPASQITSASQFRQSDEYLAANQISVAATITRIFFQTFGAAAPQMKPGDVSKEARDFGITGMKPLFRTFVDENIDAPDPYAIAYSQFVGAQLDAMKAGDPVSLESFLPFTMSSFEYPTDSPDAARASLAKPQIGTEEWREWLDSNDTKELIDQGFYASALFLAPRKGEFDFASWILGTQTLGLRKRKSHDQAIMDLLALQGEFLDSQIRNSYNERIAAIDSTTQAGRDEIKDLQEQRDNERKNVKIVNQPFDLVSGQRFEQYTDANYRASFGEMSQMLDYIENRNGELTGTPQQLRNAMNIFLHYNQQIDSLQGPGPQRNASKLDLQARMEQELNAISQIDPNAEVFIESVIKNLSYQPEFPQFGVQ